MATSGHYAIVDLTAEVSPLEFDKTETHHSIPQRFARACATRPAAAAVREFERSLTYEQLDRLSNRIAHRILKDYGTQPLRVGLIFTSTIDAVAAHLGVLKAGKTCVAIDPAYPQMRAAALLAAAGCEVALCDTQLIESTRTLNVVARVLDIRASCSLSPDTAPSVAIDPDDLAAVFFVSGPSGSPQGIVHTHRTLLHRCWSDTHYFRISSLDRISLLGSLSFSNGFAQMLAALLNGATLHPFDIRNREFTLLYEWLWSERITLFAPPAEAFRLFLDDCPAGERYDDCRCVILEGEATLMRTIEAWRRHFPPTCSLVNQLSTTEAHVISRCAIDHDTALEGRHAPIGFPDTDKEIAIVNASGDTVAPGEIGELVVSSNYLSPGYWSIDDDAVRRLPAVFCPAYGDGRIGMRTGDLVSHDGLGRLHHHGRSDGVVKLHGYRIDLREVESALLEYDGIRAAACVTRELENQRRQLVAFYVPRISDDCPSATEIRRWLINRIPDYMVPARLLAVSELPRTIHGKVSRCAVTSLELAQRSRGAELNSFENEVQRRFVEIWRSVIGHRDIGIDDDFFDVGGDDLSMVRAAAEISRCIGQRIEAGLVRETRTIRRLIEKLDRTASPLTCLSLLPESLVPHAARRPIFCIYGFYLYRPLAEALGTQFHTLGVSVEPETLLLRTCTVQGRSAGEAAGTWPPSLEQLAGTYVEQVRRRQRTGPYQLIGAQFGGVVAFEMARQLRASGETVALLGILDSYAPGALAPVTPRGWLAYAAAWAKNSVPVPFPDGRADRESRRRSQLRMEEIALARYRPDAWGGNAVLFVARAQPGFAGMATEPNLGWNELIAGQLQVHELPGDRQAMLRHPNVDALAAQLRPLLSTA